MNYAIANKDDEISFYKGENQVNSIYEDVISRNVHMNPTKVSIKSRKIDTIIAELGMDVANRSIFASLEINGAEPEALQGGHELLTKSKDFHMRIAAPYRIGSESCRSKILSILNSYPDIRIHDCPPQIVISKNN